ncbi:hypothetical protein HXX76_014688 [Chlamydomonas incerta]|uniref:CCAAT-binding factor domain-containing protein n=1 Tax=Chlamydomonas incerta TaxID=51695 RepID=A0A835SNY9_CHLIN|nr:hypothetical protein HXX76_014688 [Chlamydomonas incerta]|eukprot:KAG2424155.1 hypothetical protein HXX76_014688 [Chlamydomonas incerta]
MEAALKAAIQGLKQFFVAAGQDGHLAESVGSAAAGSRPVKRQKVDSQEPQQDAAADAEAQYRQWLGRQYAAYVSQMLALATGAPLPPASGGEAKAAAAEAAGQGGKAGAKKAALQRTAGVQVVAAAALMECVRSELGPGGFSGRLYGRLLSGVLTGPGVRPEVFALLFNKYLAMADVRFYTLATVRAVAVRYGSGVAVPRAGGAGEGEELQEAAEVEALAAAAAEVAPGPGSDGAAAGAGAGSAEPEGPGPLVALPDLTRNLLDVLGHCQPDLPADPAGWSTWCGAAEFNLVAAAADRNESARLRRKRKEQEQQEAGGVAAAGPRKVVWANAKTQKRFYSDAWLALLALPLPSDVLRKALVRLPGAVIPHMLGPQLLADFLTHCLNRGGLTGMLALNGLFLLVTRHGLEYPQFFARLYQLMVPEAFASRNRAQFFRLADLFLSSSLVPAYTVAAFVKRFARLALAAPPPGAMVAIAFIHNLVRRHPALAVMLHSPQAAAGGGGGGKGQAGAGVDVYDEAEPDPAKSRAVESSLWEVEALRNHYCPQVSTFCAVLDKDLTDRTKTAEVNLEDLLGAAGRDTPGGAAGSYNALIRGELARKLRHVPTAFYGLGLAPTCLFGAGLAEDFAGVAVTVAPSS